MQAEGLKHFEWSWEAPDFSFPTTVDSTSCQEIEQNSITALFSSQIGTVLFASRSAQCSAIYMRYRATEDI
jgi:hypothetical protein